jgi:hypothetical protein
MDRRRRRDPTANVSPSDSRAPYAPTYFLALNVTTTRNWPGTSSFGLQARQHTDPKESMT